MRIEFQTRPYPEVACDLLACPVFEGRAGAPIIQALDHATRGLVSTVLASGEFKPELHRTCLVHRPGRLKAQRLLLVGAGKKSEFSLARLRELAATAVRGACQARSRRVALVLCGGFPAAESARVAAEGALYGSYEQELYKTRDIEFGEIEGLLLLGARRVRQHEAEEAIRRGTLVGDAVNFARTLANEPANVLTPGRLAEHALAVGARTGLEVQIMERDELERLGMNALLAVARGSDQPPKLIVLRIPGQKIRKGAPFFGLVGKGVTFDSGGICLKPSDKMEDMKADMAGGAAVLATMGVLAELGSRHAVMGLIPAVENMPGGKAAKPGDIIKSYLGKTIEIINTDAEGRLILADTLAYARTLGATRLIDIATLTAACIVALGHVNAGMMGTDQEILERLKSSAQFTGERFWQLPLDDEYRKVIRSQIADIKNVGNRWGGAITAAKFLQEFVEETPWVHLDIAGVDLDHDGQPFAAKGATGFGVRTLVHLLT